MIKSDHQTNVSRRLAVTSLLTAGALSPMRVQARPDASPGGLIRAAQFGVVADGRTDDAPALLKAVAAMTDGSVLDLPPGTIALGSSGWRGVCLENLSNIQIRGNGTTLKWLALPSQVTGPIGPTGLLLHQCRNAHITDLRLDGSGVDCIGLGFDTCSHCTIAQVEAFAHGAATHARGSGLGQLASCRGQHNSWLYCHTHDSTPTSAFRGFYLGNSNPGWHEVDLRVHGCSALSNDATGFALGGEGLICTSCIAEDNAGAGFISGTADGSPSENHLFLGNIARRNRFHGWQTDVYGPLAQRIVLNGNVLEDNVHCGVMCHKGLDISIVNNRIGGNGRPTGAGAIEVTESSSIIIGENIIEGDAVHGICISFGAQPNICEDILISKNLCRGTNSKTVWIQVIGERSSLRGLIIDGNIIRGGSHALYLSSGHGAVIENAMVTNNIAAGASVADYWIDATDPEHPHGIRFAGNAGRVGHAPGSSSVSDPSE